MAMNNAIQVEELTRTFGAVTAVNRVNFTVGHGEVFAFLGPNGAGKSTTIKILCTLLKPTSGRALVNGYDVREQSDRVRASMGIVFQDTSLDSYLTAEQNLRYHCMIYHVPRAEREERIKSVLELVGLSDRRYDMVKNYSGGMRRRLEIARGLLHRPRVLFLDEPTVGLDPQTRHYVWEHIFRLKEIYETTIFMTTHYMEEAENADRIAIIDQGSIVVMDTPDNLKRGVGGDIVTLATGDDDFTEKELRAIFDLNVQRTTEGLSFEIEDGESFLPLAVSKLTAGIKRINIRHPSLDDVFLHLTGKAIREEEGVGGRGKKLHPRARKGRL